jgi:hypothetical protein
MTPTQNARSLAERRCYSISHNVAKKNLVKAFVATRL